ncbi:unnamed protein product [Polarella glacialis]|uniref:V-type proton ATPase proteolipid subunit n=1 Tax=Polarella glacialis TaxID=89957 RepID=A0A813FCB7_POLGL|nr:unnamed protein product [Polarella glacialis]
MAMYPASTLMEMQKCDPSSAFFGFMGVTSAIVFANMGAAYGTAKSGVGISSMGVMRPDMVMRSIIPVVMAGYFGKFEWLTWVQAGKVCVGAHPKLWYAAGKLMKPTGKYEHLKPSWAFASWSRSLSTFPLYGFITGVVINGKMDAATYSAYSGYAHLGAGLTVGMSSLAAGLAIGIVGDAGVRANAQQPRLFVGMILILIFAEALGLYGLIVGLVVASTAEGNFVVVSWLLLV